MRSDLLEVYSPWLLLLRRRRHNDDRFLSTLDWRDTGMDSRDRRDTEL